jgi:3',5'-cyclic AMP phosphodiesterase CpdA
MITIVHGSDLHFGAPHESASAEAFLASIRDIAPDLVVLSGDFTQRAKAREFREARAFLDRIEGVPVVVTPGNHDVPLYRVFERLFGPYRNYRTYICPDLNTVTRIPGLTVVALNSAAPRRRIVNGHISDAQLDFARTAFQEAPSEDLRALVSHHHLAPAPDYEGDKPLPGGRRILEALEEMRVELVMGGHLHRAFIGNSLDVHPGADRDRGIVIVQCGTTSSRRGRARERTKTSFNVIRVLDDRLEVVQKMDFREADGFAPFSMHAFPRLPRRFFDSDEELRMAPLYESGGGEANRRSARAPAEGKAAWRGGGE